MTLCISNAVLVTPHDMRPGGVLTDGEGRIAALLGPADRASADTVIDARERLLFPGFIDAHVHMRDPGFAHKEDFASGTRAAACGGVTTVMCMPNTKPPVNSRVGFAAARAAGTGRSHVDFTLQAAAETDNLEQLEWLWAAGVTSFELFMTDVPPPAGVDDTSGLLEILREVARLRGVVGIFCGSRSVLAAAARPESRRDRADFVRFAESRPAVNEAVGVATVLEAARATGAATVLRQLCTARAFQLVRRAKADGDPIRVEVNPHHLRLDREALTRLGPYAHMLPPLQSAADRDAAIDAAADGTVDFVASDHAPHLAEEKRADDAWSCPGGTPGLDTLAPAVLDLACGGRVGFPDVARLLAAGPAEAFGIAGRKGTLSPGADADLVLVDPAIRRTVRPEHVRSRAGRSPFEGRTLSGWPVLTALRGEIVAEAGELRDDVPRGCFVARGDR